MRLPNILVLMLTRRWRASAALRAPSCDGTPVLRRAEPPNGSPLRVANGSTGSSLAARRGCVWRPRRVAAPPVPRLALLGACGWRPAARAAKLRVSSSGSGAALAARRGERLAERGVVCESAERPDARIGECCEEQRTLDEAAPRLCRADASARGELEDDTAGTPCRWGEARDASLSRRGVEVAALWVCVGAA